MTAALTLLAKGFVRSKHDRPQYTRPAHSRASGVSPVPQIIAGNTCLAEHQGDGQPSFGGLLVFRVHFPGCERHRVYGRIEVNPAVSGDLVARDHKAGPCLDCAERATFDAGNLHEPGNGIAGHPKVMFERRFSGVRHYLMAKVARLGYQSSTHGGRDTDLRLAAAFRSGKGGVVFAEIADRRGCEQSVPEFLLRQVPAALT